MNIQFRAAGIPLSNQKIDKPFLRGMYKATKGAEIEEGKEEALAAIEQLGKTGEMSEDGLDALNDYRKAVYKEWRADKDRMWSTWRSNGKNWKDPAIKAIKKEMGINGAFLMDNQTFTTELREAGARVAVEALAGANFGPAGVIAGYSAYANGRQWSGADKKATESLVNTYKAYESGESRMSTDGNNIEQVHREELWKILGTLTGEAAESGQKGDPLPITAQYYELTSPEMIGNLATAAKAGSKLRLNLDPGRLSYPSKDRETGNKYFEIDDIPHKMRTILQFANIEGADVGVSIFPMEQELGDPTDLMHRKVLRVGDKVLMSGMNANMGSGENIDAGYVVEGPAAAVLTENVARDIDKSAGRGMDDIWGAEHVEMFRTEDLRVGRRGITALLDGLQGPSPAGADLPRTTTLASLEKLAKKAGVKLADLVDVPAEDYKEVMSGIARGEGEISLSAEGKEQLLALMERAVDATQTKKNIKALDDISLPSDKKVGDTRVDIADLPSEREVLTINAIMEAEEFILVPGFVVTRAVAGAIVAKQKQAIAAGKPLDIRVIADSGVYPDGGTPNKWGVNFLEDNGIETRWSKLTRTNWHDRKIHAKQLLTDKGEIAGSTNFSKKGMRENWETSAYVHFEEGDKEAAELRDQSKAQFEELWETETFDFSARDLATYNNRFAPKLGREWAIEQDRDYSTKKIVQAIEVYEEDTAVMMEKLVERPDIKARRTELLENGYSEGDSALMAVEDVLGREEFMKMKNELPGHKKLMAMKNKFEKWNAKYGNKN